MESFDTMQYKDEIENGKINPAESLGENGGNSNSTKSLSIFNIDDDSELTQRFHIGIILY
jgi:hypothetical protein